MFPRNARAGATLEVMRATALQTMRFFVYPVAHEAIHRKPAWEGTSVTKAIAGAACALPEALIITPMEVWPRRARASLLAPCVSVSVPPIAGREAWPPA